MSRPFETAEGAFVCAEDAHHRVPEIPVQTMPTSALLAEFISYLLPNEDRYKVVGLGWGTKLRIDDYKLRRDEVTAEIDRRIPIPSV